MRNKRRKTCAINKNKPIKQSTLDSIQFDDIINAYGIIESVLSFLKIPEILTKACISPTFKSIIYTTLNFYQNCTCILYKKHEIISEARFNFSMNYFDEDEDNNIYWTLDYNFHKTQTTNESNIYTISCELNKSKLPIFKLFKRFLINDITITKTFNNALTKFDNLKVLILHKYNPNKIKETENLKNLLLLRQISHLSITIFKFDDIIQSNSIDILLKDNQYLKCLVIHCKESHSVFKIPESMKLFPANNLIALRLFNLYLTKKLLQNLINSVTNLKILSIDSIMLLEPLDNLSCIKLPETIIALISASNIHMYLDLTKCKNLSYLGVSNLNVLEKLIQQNANVIIDNIHYIYFDQWVTYDIFDIMKKYTFKRLKRVLLSLVGYKSESPESQQQEAAYINKIRQDELSSKCKYIISNATNNLMDNIFKEYNNDLYESFRLFYSWNSCNLTKV